MAQGERAPSLFHRSDNKRCGIKIIMAGPSGDISVVGSIRTRTIAASTAYNCVTVLVRRAPLGNDVRQVSSAG
jgi:hypothetical protein